jgi:hypothetical protein
MMKAERTRVLIAGLAACGALAGCAERAGDAEAAGGEGREAQVAAERCALFVDNLQASSPTGGLAVLRFYLKTKLPVDPATGAPAEVKEVGVGYDGCVTSFGGSPTCFQGRSATARSFEGASDYFTVELPIADGGGVHAYGAAFFVTYEINGEVHSVWANANDRPGENFVINAEMYDNVRRASSPTSPGGFGRITTADSFPYMNPNGCR